MISLRSWLASHSDSSQRELIWVIALGIIQGFVSAMVTPMLPLLLKSLGAGDLELGLVAVVPAVIAIVAGIPISAVSLKYGGRVAVLSSFMLGCVCSAMLFMASSLSHIVVAQLAFGLSQVIYYPTQSAYMVQVISIEHRTRIIGYVTAVTSLGAVLGSVFGGVLVDHVGFRAVYAVYFSACVIGLIGCRRLPVTQRDASMSIFQAVGHQVGSVYSLLTRPMLQIVTLNTLVLFVNQGITDVFLPVYLKGVGYTATLVGTAATFRTIGALVMKLSLDPVSRRLGRVNMLFGGVATTALLMGAIPLLPVAP